jgi:hypothetical protein
MRHKVTTELRYPGLWRGCVGAWNPGLGPSGLTLRDWSGFRSNGQFTNTGSTLWSVRQGRQSCLFDGVDDYVSLGFNRQLNITSQITIVGWINTTSYAVQTLFANGLGAGFAGYAFAINIGSGGSSGNGRMGYWNGSSWVGTSTDTGVVDGTWRMVTLTNNGATTTIYVGTNPVFSGAHGFANSNAVEQRIGMREGSTHPFNGYIGEVLVYNRVISLYELHLLARRPGIAYELAPRRRSSVAVAAGGFNAAWIPRRSLVIGGGTN